MADFCRQCAIEVFGEDHGDLEGLCKEGELAGVICEGCGPTNVNSKGECVLHGSSGESIGCLKSGAPWSDSEREVIDVKTIDAVP